jgi:group I intron endonuclease
MSNDYNKTCGIYRILNIKSGRVYVGSSKNLQKRRTTHTRELVQNKHINKFLQNDYNRCGQTNFVFEIIEQYSFYNKNFVLRREQYYLNKYYDGGKRCYNIAPLVSCPSGNTGKRFSEETRLKMSLAQKGKRHSQETKKRQSEAKLKLYSDKTNHPKFGKKMSKEICEKLSLIHKERWKQRKLAK